jgi:hypothetical protein
LFIQDVIALCDFFDGADLRDPNPTHFCWCNATQKPCCKNRYDALDKGNRLLSNVIVGRADKIPASGTWTHMLSSMQINIIRRLLWRLGLNGYLDKMLEEPPQEMKIDAEAVQHQAAVINSVRLYNTQVYFKKR